MRERGLVFLKGTSYCQQTIFYVRPSVFFCLIFIFDKSLLLNFLIGFSSQPKIRFKGELNFYIFREFKFQLTFLFTFGFKDYMNFMISLYNQF